MKYLPLFLLLPVLAQADADNMQFCLPTAAMIIADNYQAAQLTRRENVEETNLVLGRKPTPAEFAAYAVAATATVCTVGHHLSKENRRMFYGFVMGLEYGLIWIQFHTK